MTNLNNNKLFSSEEKVLVKALEMLNIKDKKLNLSYKFIEWFRGFTDAEGCFQIIQQSSGDGKYFEFRYSISLHIDDKAALYYIQENLQMGRVKENYKENLVTYNIIAQKEVGLIIELFTIYTLNTNKYLNFVAFKEAFLIYITWKELDRCELILQLKRIQDKMNFKRIDFLMPNNHKISISSYWLLGFIEGDGSFCYHRKDKYARFHIGQKGNKELIIAIKEYLISIIPLDNNVLSTSNCNWINISSYKNLYSLNISNTYYLQFILIPLLDNLNWHTKKQLDYYDWKYIVAIIIKGLHYTPEGIRLIEIIISQMNDYRLSTSKSKVKQCSYSKLEIEKFINEFSNYEVKNNKLFIKSLNRYKKDNSPLLIEVIDNESKEIICSFSSLSECAIYFNIARSTAKNRMIKKKSFLTKNGKLVILRNI